MYFEVNATNVNVEYSKFPLTCGSEEISVWDHVQPRERARSERGVGFYDATPTEEGEDFHGFFLIIHCTV